MKNSSYYHSCRTISEYLEPLLKLGLVKREDNRYASTVYGKKVNAIFKEFSVENALPMHSSCYEESVLIELLHGAKTYEDLAKTIPSLSRVMGRLQEEGLITKKKKSNHIFYFRTQGKVHGKLSPTERRILENVLEEGVTARKLSRRVDITLRRTYKYLRRLREKQLVFTKDIPKNYKLTKLGKEVAKLLDELVRFISSVSNFYLLNKRSNS
jgi:predicted transcriptional regulator